MKVFFTSPTKQDQKELEDAGLKASLLDDRVKIVAVDDNSHVGTLFMGQKDYDRLNSQTAGLFACLRTIFTMTRPEIQIKLSLLVL